jgi:hypothetical protein
MDRQARPRPASPSRATVDPPRLVTLVPARARFENGKTDRTTPATNPTTRREVTPLPHSSPIHRS